VVTDRLRLLASARQMRHARFDPHAVLEHVASEVSCWRVGATARWTVSTAVRQLVQVPPTNPMMSLQQWWLDVEGTHPPLAAARPFVVGRRCTQRAVHASGAGHSVGATIAGRRPAC
jgi:hypothetical protein